MENALIYDLNEYRAKSLVEDGKHMIFEGDLDGAVEIFEKSLVKKPSAEGYTYLGWVLSLKGRLDEAIEYCKKAICIDSKYGNPFNDIGNYLIQKNELENAIPWLEEAKLKPDYECRHFPFINLGRIYAAMERYDDAIDEFEQALDYAPDHDALENVIAHIKVLRGK